MHKRQVQKAGRNQSPKPFKPSKCPHLQHTSSATAADMPYRHYDESNKTNTLCNIHVRLLYYIVAPGIAAAMNIMQMAVEAIVLHGNTGCCGSRYYAHQQASISRRTAAANMLACVHASELNYTRPESKPHTDSKHVRPGNVTSAAQTSLSGSNDCCSMLELLLLPLSVAAACPGVAYQAARDGCCCCCCAVRCWSLPGD